MTLIVHGQAKNSFDFCSLFSQHCLHVGTFPWNVWNLETLEVLSSMPQVITENYLDGKERVYANLMMILA